MRCYLKEKAAPVHYTFNNMSFELSRRYRENASENPTKELSFDCVSPVGKLAVSRVENSYYYLDDAVERYFENTVHSGGTTEMTSVAGHPASVTRSDQYGNITYEISLGDKYSKLARLSFSYDEGNTALAEKEIQKIIDSIRFE